MRKSRIAATFWIFFGLSYLIYSFKYYGGAINDPAPGFFPRIIGGVTIFFGLLELSSSFRKRKVTQKQEEDLRSEYGKRLFVASMCVICMAAYIAVINYIGFLLASPFLLFALCWLMGSRNWVANLIVSIGSSVIIYYTFWIIMRVPIPLGTLWKK